MQEENEVEVSEVTTEETSEESKDLSLQVKEPTLAVTTRTMWNDVSVFEATQRMARALAASDLIPPSYNGKLSNCMIAIDIANRIGVSPMVVMQNSSVINNRFSWSGTACKAMIDGCGKYRTTRYVQVGEEGTDSYGFYLEAVTNEGETVKGVPVTVQMAKDEGWWKRNPKWASLTTLMLKYRAAAFFFRTECASLAMGFLTAEEQEDISTK